MRIRLLGGLAVTSAEGNRVRFATRKSSLLFAGLVLAGPRGHRRELLAEAFWPARGDAQSRNSLRQALVDIRRSIPAGSAISVEADNETVALAAGPDEVDVWVLERKIAEGRTTADLAAAADLYRGDVLAQETFPAGLEEWFAPYRSKYQRKAEQLVERLSLALTEPGTAAERACEALAERLLLSDPLLEAAHRTLMRIEGLRGRENAALRQFEACRALLRKHLDAEPEAETTALAASLQARSSTGSRRAVAEPEPKDADLASAKRHDRPSVAVMPFQNLSGDPEQDYFADGIVEEIITALAHFRQLTVIARNSSFAFKGQAVDIKHVGRVLDARYIVEGSVRRTGERLRIAGQLIDAATGINLWADRFDGTPADVFDLQDRVAASIVGAIAPKVEEAEIERAKHKPTASLDAYDFYLRGLALFDRTVTIRSSVDEALRLFKAAIDRDPEFAAAYARAARCYAARKSNGWMVDPVEETAEATRLARCAVERGRDDAIALTFGGYVLGYVAGDLDEAAACIDRALALNPNLGAALGSSSWVRACLGEPDKAIEHAALAMRLSPLDPRLFAWQFNTSLAHFCGGRYDEAAAWAVKSLRLQPNYTSALRVAAASYALAGRPSDARAMIDRLRHADPALMLSNVSHVLPPFRRSDDRDRYLEALRRAGLPA